jgi:polyferredoxin
LRSEIKQRLLKFNTPRRIVQLLSFIFFSAIVFNISSLPLLLPVLWTWGISPNAMGDAFTAIQLMLYDVVFPWLAVASFLLVGILIGKSLCGWICPFGFMQDLVDFIKRRKMEIVPRTHKTMLYVKYGVLGIALFVSVTFSVAKALVVYASYEGAIGIFAKAPFTTLSPSETLFAAVPKIVRDFANAVSVGQLDVFSGILSATPLLWVQLFILGAVMIFVAYVPRGWCKYFCPHGAIMAILNRFSFLGLRRDPARCAKAECRQCVEVCPMRVPILDLPWEKFSHPECIYCLKCVDACSDGAIKLKYP